MPKEEKELAFLKFWPKAGIAELDESTFISIAGMLENKEIYQMVKPVIQDGVYAAAYIHFALQNHARVQSSELSRLLRPLAHQLIRSDSLSAVTLALDAAVRLNMGNLRKTDRKSVVKGKRGT